MITSCGQVGAPVSMSRAQSREDAEDMQCISEAQGSESSRWQIFTRLRFGLVLCALSDAEHPLHVLCVFATLRAAPLHVPAKLKGVSRQGGEYSLACASGLYCVHCLMQSIHCMSSASWRLCSRQHCSEVERRFLKFFRSTL